MGQKKSHYRGQHPRRTLFRERTPGNVEINGSQRARSSLCLVFQNLSPGLRVGWTLPGRFADQVKRLKMNSTVASPTLNQQVVAQFLKTGGFERHLRRLRTALKNQITNTALAIARHFPDGTRITAPRGGSPCGWSWTTGWMASRFSRRPASAIYPFSPASSAPRRGAIATISASAAAIPGARRWKRAS
jgi:hypothetical protein